MEKPVAHPLFQVIDEELNTIGKRIPEILGDNIFFQVYSTGTMESPFYV
jgi:hypothetical protein